MSDENVHNFFKGRDLKKKKYDLLEMYMDGAGIKGAKALYEFLEKIRSIPVDPNVGKAVDMELFVQGYDVKISE